MFFKHLSALALTVSLAAPLFASAQVSTATGCVDFGIAKDYNAVIFGDFRGSSDVQGKLAVQGNAEMSTFSVADQLTTVKQCDEYTTVVRGNAVWTSGRNYFGNMAVGGSSTGVDQGVIEHGCRVDTKSDVFDFEKSYKELTDLSKSLNALASTVVSETTELTERTWTFSGKPLEVVNVDQPLLFKDGTVTTIKRPVNFVPGSTLVINIRGAEPGMTGDHEALAPFNVIYNFPDATKLDVNAIGVQGYILAPNAVIKDVNGVVNGSVFVKTFQAPLQVNWKPLKCGQKCRLRQNPPLKCKARQPANSNTY